jgi:hypothetical protein
VFVEVLVMKSVSHKSYRLCIQHPVHILCGFEKTGGCNLRFL